MINLIKTHLFETRLFEHLSEDMDAEHKCLLLHTNVRWLSWGKSLNRVFEFREPLQRFPLEKNSDLADKFSDEKWVLKLDYLCHIFNLLNKLSLSLQAKWQFYSSWQIKWLHKDKIKLWYQRADKGYLTCFKYCNSRDFERQRAWASVLRPCEQSLACSFTRVQALKTHELQRNGSVIHLFSNRVNRPYLSNKRTNCWTLQMMVARNVFFVRLCQCFGWRSCQNTLTLA